MSATVAVCGKGWLACEALGQLHDLAVGLRTGWRPVAVPVAGDSGADTWEPSLRTRCMMLDVVAYSSVAELQLGAGDVLFSLQYDRIVRLPELGGARAYNLHFSALPQYRGCYPSMWPLRNGERQVGVTLHVLAAGIDDGDVVDQELFDVPPFATAFELYRLYHRHAYQLFSRNLQAVLEARETRRPQEHAKSSYYDRKSIDFGARELTSCDRRSVRECLDFLRSLMFDPYQMPSFAGRLVLAAEALHWRTAHSATPGAVIECTASSAIVRCRDGWLRLRFAD